MIYATSSRDISGVVGLLGCEEPVSHLILQPKLLDCVRPHVDLTVLRSLCVRSRPDRQ